MTFMRDDLQASAIRRNGELHARQLSMLIHQVGGIMFYFEVVDPLLYYMPEALLMNI